MCVHYIPNSLLGLDKADLKEIRPSIIRFGYVRHLNSVSVWDLLFYRFLLGHWQDLVLAKLVNTITVAAPLWALLFRLMSVIQ